MMFKIKDKLKIGTNLSVSVAGVPKDLKNGSIVKDERGAEFVVLSMAMVNHKDPAKIKEETTMLLKGKTDIGEEIYI